MTKVIITGLLYMNRYSPLIQRMQLDSLDSLKTGVEKRSEEFIKLKKNNQTYNLLNHEERICPICSINGAVLRIRRVRKFKKCCKLTIQEYK